MRATIITKTGTYELNHVVSVSIVGGCTVITHCNDKDVQTSTYSSDKVQIVITEWSD